MHENFDAHRMGMVCADHTHNFGYHIKEIIDMGTAMLKGPGENTACWEILVNTY